MLEKDVAKKPMKENSWPQAFFIKIDGAGIQYMLFCFLPGMLEDAQMNPANCIKMKSAGLGQFPHALVGFHIRVANGMEHLCKLG